LTRPTVAITGASSGIGETFARKLAPEHDLLLIARREERLNRLARELNEQFGTASEVLVADLTKEADQNRVAQRIETHPTLLLLINNAGFGSKGRFWESPLEVQLDMHRLHVMATVRLTHAALRNLVPRDIGGVINLASVSAFVRNAGSVSYGATKSWMASFSEGLYLELKGMGSNVAVQALCPGFTYTEFHDRMAVNRQKLAGSAFWMTADQIVDASLEGLAKRKLYVIPGWRYRLLTTFLTKIPTAMRLFVETVATRNRQHAMGVEAPPSKQIGSAQ
jgi:short-subunit dehydrogenase